MQAGKLNEIVEIYRPDLEKNEFGETVQVYKRSYETRAEVINQSGTRDTQNNEVIYAYNKTFRIRRYVPVNESCWIRYKYKKYRILSIEDNRKFNELIIDTELVNE